MCHFFFPNHILKSSLIYYWTDARQHGIYLLNCDCANTPKRTYKTKPKPIYKTLNKATHKIKFNSSFISRRQETHRDRTTWNMHVLASSPRWLQSFVWFHLNIFTYTHTHTEKKSFLENGRNRRTDGLKGYKDKTRITLREDNLIVSSVYVSKFPKPGRERWQLYHSSEGSIRKLVISQVIE